MYSLKSLTHQRQYSHLQHVVSLLAATLVAATVCVAPALAQKPATFADPVTFCTVGEDGSGECLLSRPMGLVVADFVDMPGEQDDGYPDVAVINTTRNPRSVSVFHNTGDWAVPSAALVRTGEFSVGYYQDPYDITAADVTGEHGDGDLDLIVTLYDSGQIVILENLGLGQFQAGVPIDISPPGRDIWDPRGLVAGDFDLDNRMDLAVGAADYEFGVGAVVLFWKEPDGDWDKQVLGEEHNMPWGYGTDIVAGSVVKKLVSPAYHDLVVAVTDFHQNPNLVTLVNLGRNREFAPGIVSPAATEGDFTHGPMGIALGRFRTGVIQPDLVAADEFNYPAEGDSADVYWNDAFGNFTFKQEYLLESGEQVGRDPYSVAVGKINGDTRQDIVSTIGHNDPCNPGGGIAVFVGHGDGTFREPPYLFCVDPDPNKEPKPKFVKIADMDQDGFNDVVTSNNWNGHNISVLINSLKAIPGG